MKINLVILVTLFVAALCSCGSTPMANNVATVKPTPLPSIVSPASSTPVPTPSTPKNGDYNGKGIVTKVAPESPSIELNHEEIKGMMPAMQMEFFVSDKKLLNGVKVGDKVDFVVRYKDATETIVGIKKAQ